MHQGDERRWTYVTKGHILRLESSALLVHDTVTAERQTDCVGGTGAGRRRPWNQRSLLLLGPKQFQHYWGSLRDWEVSVED